MDLNGKVEFDNSLKINIDNSIDEILSYNIENLPTFNADMASIAVIQMDSIGLPYDDTEIKESLSKKADLVNGKILLTQLPDDIGSGGESYDDTEIKESLSKKADLVNGKILLTQLPDDIGSGGITSDITLTTTLNSILKVAKNQPLNITFKYENSKSKPGALTLKINNTQKLQKKIELGENSIEIGEFLTRGANQIRIEVTDAFNGMDFLLFDVSVLELELTSTFNYKTFYSGTIPFNYIAKGDISKTIHYILDGVELGTEIVTTSGIQRIYNIPKQEHGGHKFEVYATCQLGENLITSNKLTFGIICYDEGNLTPIISSNFGQTTGAQYSAITIPYIIYTPNQLLSDVVLKINGVEKSQLQVDRTEQKWNTLDFSVGENTFTICTGSLEKNFLVTISEVILNIEEEIENLDLHLTSLNRNNSEVNKEIWENNNIRCLMNNFNWKTNGWVSDNDNLPVMRIKDGATIEIPIKPFSKDFKLMGKTFEFEFLVSDVIDYNSTIISCMQENKGFTISCREAIFKTNELTINTQFKDNERIRLSFVIEDIGKNRLIYTYVNGIISGINQYTESEIFTQQTPINITIGSTNCTLDIYNIRIYSRGLDSKGILNNYIYDMSNANYKITLYNRNRVYDEYGQIMYNKILEQMPCMIITGELPPVKGNKKIVDIQYENQQEPERNFSNIGASIDIQGTSSQYYPKKNYKFKLTQKYKLRANAIEEGTYTIKADYMESSHAHNTGIAKIVHNVYSEKIPPQITDPLVRTCIDGFPIAVFYKSNVDAPLNYFGIYNFNNDKADNNTFGYTSQYPKAQSWEVTNNTSDRCLLKKSEYSIIDATTGLPEWQTDFEARYPDDYTDSTDLKRLTDWIVSTKDNVEKFKTEFSQYFNQHYVLTYYIITEAFAMIDSRAKNMFLSTWDGLVWYPVFYDMDTAFGLNNEGVLGFDYSVEGQDTLGSLNVFNGKDSLLWKNVELAFPNEIKELYKTMRNNGKLTYDGVMKILANEQINKICEIQYNEDAIYKYLTPLYQENNSTYLYLSQGNRINHLKYWLYNRFKYMDSKYVASDYKSNYATFRLYTPSEWQVVQPNANFTLLPFTDQYVGIKYGSYEKYARAAANVPIQITAPDITFNDTETILYGADRLLSLGDLSDKYAGTIDVSKATQLSELLIGNSSAGYSNTNLHNLSIGNNRLLRKLDVSNCPNLRSVVDLTGCAAIEEVYLKGTGISSVKLPTGNNLKKLHLPNSIVNLELINKTNLNELIIEGYDNINVLVIDNINLNSFDIFNNCKNLQLIRVMNINGETTKELLDLLYTYKGVDNRGVEIPISEAISGNIKILRCSPLQLNGFKTKFPYVEFTVETFLDDYTVNFKDGDGNILYTDIVFEGGDAIYKGPTPTKTSIPQYDYSFNNWDSPLKPIAANCDINATFTQIVRKYTIKFINSVTGEVISSQYLDYGSTPTIPAYPSDFNSWDKAVKIVTKDEDYTAILIPYPSDLTLFTFTDYTHDGVPGYKCAISATRTLPANLIFPNYYNNKPVHWIIGEQANTTRKNVTQTHIPNTVKIIGDYTFYSCINLLSVEIPNSVTEIQSYAFYNCSKITTITLPDSVTILKNNCFRSCTLLASVIFSQNLISIGDYGFAICGSLKKKENFILPNSLKTLGTNVFNTCGFESFVMPDSVASVGGSLFIGNRSLIDVVFSKNLTELPEHIFYDCSSLKTVNLQSISRLGSGIFSGCGIENITIPASVISMSDLMFYNCSQLISVNIEAPITTLSGNTFKNCTSLTTVNLPKTIDNVGENCFYNCTSLTSLIIPGPVRWAGAFTGTNGLTTLQLGSPGVPVAKSSELVWAKTTFSGMHAAITIYTIDGYGLTGQPWGGTNCSFIYKKA